MKKHEDTAFQNEIARRTADPGWSAEIAGRVFARARAERRQGIVNAAAALFPLAAAAVLVIVLMFRSEVQLTAMTEPTDVHEVVSSDIDGILGETWNY